MFMEDNSQNVERNLNKLFEKMYAEKYPDLIDYGVFTVTYHHKGYDYDDSGSYYEIHLAIHMKPNVGGYHGFAKKLGVKSADLRWSFKDMVKYVQPYNMDFDLSVYQDED